MEDLNGEMVIVHPKLINDPAHSQGNIGILTKIDIPQDEVHVRFANGVAGIYSSDALLTMKDPTQFYRDIVSQGSNLSVQDQKTVLRANMFQGSGTVKAMMDAMDMIRSSEDTLTFSTITLQEKIAVALKQDQEKTTSIGRGI